MDTEIVQKFVELIKKTRSYNKVNNGISRDEIIQFLKQSIHLFPQNAQQTYIERCNFWIDIFCKSQTIIEYENNKYILDNFPYYSNDINTQTIIKNLYERVLQISKMENSISIIKTANVLDEIINSSLCLYCCFRCCFCCYKH